MPYGHYQHHQLLLLQLTDDAVVPQPIPPQPKLASSKGFAEIVRVFGRRDPIVHVIDDFPLDRPVEPLEILQRARIVFLIVQAKFFAHLPAGKGSAALLQTRLREIAIF